MKKFVCFATTSLPAVQASLIDEFGKKRVKICLPGINSMSPDHIGKLKKAKAVLVPGVNNLKAHKQILDEATGTVLVFDSPLNLKKVRNTLWFDLPKQPDFEVLSFRFNPKPINYNKLFKLIKTKAKPSKIKPRKIDLLDNIIKYRANGEFAEIFASFLYYNTSIENRHLIISELRDFFYDHNKISVLKKAINSLQSNVQRKKLIKDILGYLQSVKGKRLIAAVKQARAVKVKSYIKFAKQENVNAIDLKLILAMNKINLQ